MNTYLELTKIFNKAKRFKYPYKQKDFSSSNGIYIMFEKNEKFNGMDRVVRIGSHTGQNRLADRIDEHYIGNDHRDSIFRLHLGRCFLVIDKKTDYLKIWDSKIKRPEDKIKNYDKIDWNLEDEYEAKITEYIQNNFSFTIIPKLINEEQRLRLENGLIATFAQEKEKNISENWLGNFHPNIKICNSGLWNIHHIKGLPITLEEYKQIIEKLK